MSISLKLKNTLNKKRKKKSNYYFTLGPKLFVMKGFWMKHKKKICTHHKRLQIWWNNSTNKKNSETFPNDCLGANVMFRLWMRENVSIQNNHTKKKFLLIYLLKSEQKKRIPFFNHTSLLIEFIFSVPIIMVFVSPSTLNKLNLKTKLSRRCFIFF